MANKINGYRICAQGVVQGVGFRPFVWRVATDAGLCGRVWNDAAGVQIELQASEAELARFLDMLAHNLPPLARLDALHAEPVTLAPVADFTIVASQQGRVSTGCAPDAATCPTCRSELFDPADRRYRYPFINCTHCGPRLSIIRQIPYDRASTTMAAFIQCPACLVEYNDPADRRFHAQPNACPECGPRVWLEDSSGHRIGTDDPFLHLSAALRAGQIVALKGLGGFHLACDATDTHAVARLRARKQRPDKAFALMVRDCEVLARYAQPEAEAIALMRAPQAPVVLLDPVDNRHRPLAEGIAPGQYQLGFMLPYTPVHQLLMETLDRPLVMTSGNRAAMPQALDNEEAREQLAQIADLFLMHDRPIQNRVDDSVVRVADQQIHMLRRARGYAPVALPLPPGFGEVPDLIALGAELKNTLCLIQSGRAILTQHLGDLEDARTYEQYQHTLSLYRNLYQHDSKHYVCDMHPEYLSSKYGEQLAEAGNQLLRVQHHHAHLAACLGENGYPLDGAPVLGICLDGTGYGLDGTLWGGEFLLGGYRGIERVAYLKPFPLVGGAQAIRAPWRCLYAQLVQAQPAQTHAQWAQRFPVLADKPCATLDKMIEKGLNSPLTSSAGRLFDAVAAALGCHGEAISYEGQAAIELETLARRGNPDTPCYPFTLRDGVIDPAPLWHALTQDIVSAGRSKADMARAFHKGFVAAVLQQVQQLKVRYGFTTVALSGGVMQNGLLFSALSEGLREQGLTLLTHHQLPANDGCIAFGQALVAAANSAGCTAP